MFITASIQQLCFYLFEKKKCEPKVSKIQKDTNFKAHQQNIEHFDWHTDVQKVNKQQYQKYACNFHHAFNFHLPTPKHV